MCVLTFGIIDCSHAEFFVIPVPQVSTPRLSLTVLKLNTSKVTASNTIYIVKAKGFLPEILLPRNHSLARTSRQANKEGCLAAINGGPFNTDGSVTGAVVSDGKFDPDSDFLNSVGFGITSSPRPKWVIGTIATRAEAHALHLYQFVSGFDWLVQEGINVAPLHNDTTGAQRAPRTAIGVDNSGNLIMFVADGCEKWLVHTYHVR